MNVVVRAAAEHENGDDGDDEASSASYSYEYDSSSPSEDEYEVVSPPKSTELVPRTIAIDPDDDGDITMDACLCDAPLKSTIEFTHEIDRCATMGHGLEARTSQIRNAGMGLFAQWYFVPGQIVTEYTGQLLNAANENQRLLEHHGDKRYMVSIVPGDDDACVECDRRRAVRAREYEDVVVLNGAVDSTYQAIDFERPPMYAGGGAWANDAAGKNAAPDDAENNCVFMSNVDCRGKPRVVLVARDHIYPGDEIYVGYGDAWWREHYGTSGGGVEEDTRSA